MTERTRQLERERPLDMIRGHQAGDDEETPESGQRSKPSSSSPNVSSEDAPKSEVAEP